MHKKITTALIVSFIAASFTAGTVAQAEETQTRDTTQTTETTVEITGGGLEIVAPIKHDLGQMTKTDKGIMAGKNGPMKGITVTDERADGEQAWNASVKLVTDMIDAADPAKKIAKANVLYAATTAVAGSGEVVTLNQSNSVADENGVLELSSHSLGADREVVAATGIIGANKTTWDAKIGVNLQASTLVGNYSAELLHTVV